MISSDGLINWGAGSVKLRGAVWYLQIRRTDKKGKRVNKWYRVGTLEEIPTQEAARNAADKISLKNPRAIRQRTSSERKSLPKFTLDWYSNKLRSQYGRCAICGQHPRSQLVVDHDHQTGELRGLLCSTCNTGIGMLRDDIGLLHMAAMYLQQYGQICARPVQESQDARNLQTVEFNGGQRRT